MTEISVLLADDQSLVRLGFRLLLEATEGFRVVGEAEDGRAAVDAVGRLDPDVVLMDIRMPKMDGIAATEAVVRQHPRTRVLVLTTFDLDEYVFAALRVGAGGFLLKDAQPGELIAAIRAIAAGDAVIAPRVTRRMLDLFGHTLGSSAGRAEARMVAQAADGALATLTQREREVLQLIAAGQNNAEIAGALFVAESTVKTHIGRVLAKIGARDRVHAVILAYEWGLAPGDAGSSVAGR